MNSFAIRKQLSFASNFIRLYGWMTCCLLSLNLAIGEDRSTNPLYQALPPSIETLKSLFKMESSAASFIPVSFRESLQANWFPTESNFFEDLGVKIAEARFERFCQELKMSDSSLCPFSIPPIIHLIWLGSEPPQGVEVTISSWQKHHPDWKIQLWTDKEVEHFEWSCPRSENIFRTGKNWAEKSDILRFEILYQFGGIYTDTDVICFKSFQDLVRNGLTVFAGFESNKIKRFGRPLIGSSIIGAAKNSGVIKMCIDYTQSQEEAPNIHQHIRSGPGCITKACYKALEEGVETVLLLPCSYFYPLPWEKRLASPNEIIENIRPESFAIHLWEGSWFDSYHPPQTPLYNVSAGKEKS